MKAIKGGFGLCTQTNCIASEDGNECATFDESHPGEDCNWGICIECCDGPDNQ